ncbi:MAG: tRNA epoxyqueuosine(34) reductase QueG [Deltaproteobacteria bacterium]|nr:tRNA epoxyqueuosine(34) reductase QueG [Deltaproteobacteria bacterium]
MTSDGRATKRESATALVETIRQLASELGFVAVGVCRAQPSERFERFETWLAAGQHGEMRFLERNVALRRDPRLLLPDAQSAVVLAMAYSGGSDPATRPGEGRVARYARGQDYHRLLRQRIEQLVAALRERYLEPLSYRVAVDSAPLLERELAEAAGLGFIGKNTMLITPGIGSYTVLGTLLLSIALPANERQPSRCGSCDLCLKACPTAALVSERQLDARRCISYLTIEKRGEISPELRRQIGDWVFGCDICQEVCPFNARPGAAVEPMLSGPATLPLPELSLIKSSSYRRFVRDRAFNRTPRPMWQRNAQIVDDNQRHRRRDRTSPT